MMMASNRLVARQAAQMTSLAFKRAAAMVLATAMTLAGTAPLSAQVQTVDPDSAYSAPIDGDLEPAPAPTGNTPTSEVPPEDAETPVAQTSANSPAADSAAAPVPAPIAPSVDSGSLAVMV